MQGVRRKAQTTDRADRAGGKGRVRRRGAAGNYLIKNQIIIMYKPPLDFQQQNDEEDQEPSWVEKQALNENDSEKFVVNQGNFQLKQPVQVAQQKVFQNEYKLSELRQPSESSEESVDGILFNNHLPLNVYEEELVLPSGLGVASQGSKARRSRTQNRRREQRGDFHRIADRVHAQEILHIFAQAGQYRLQIPENGPFSHIYDKINALNKYLDDKNNPVKQLFKKDQISQPDFFFLRPTVPKFKFRNGELEPTDESKYKGFKPKYCGEKYSDLCKAIEKVSRQLSEDFHEDLQRIVSTYIERRQESVDAAVDALLKVQDKEWQHIPRWNSVKQSYKMVQILRKQVQITERRQSIDKRQAHKVRQKYQQMIEKEQNDLDLELRVSPLEYLLRKLFKVFDNILAGTPDTKPKKQDG